MRAAERVTPPSSLRSATVVTLGEFDKAIRELTGEHIEARPFLCEGSPFGCEVFLVGINPGTPTPFWPYWRLPYGCYKQEWLRDYMSRPGNKPTRNNTERIIRAAAPVRCLDTNVYCRYSPREASLPAEHEDTRVFDYLLRTLTPKVLFVHGESAIEHVRQLAGNMPLPHGQFTRVNLFGMPVDVITGPHLSYPSARWPERVDALGRALRERCQNPSGQLSDNVLSTSVDDAASLDRHPQQLPPTRAQRGVLDFEAAWEYLRKHTPLTLETAGGIRFTAHVSDTSIAYERPGDQRRTQTKDNLERYFRTWFVEGRRNRDYFRNFTGARSPSARFKYFSAVFRHLEDSWKGAEEEQT